MIRSRMHVTCVNQVVKVADWKTGVAIFVNLSWPSFIRQCFTSTLPTLGPIDYTYYTMAGSSMAASHFQHCRKGLVN